MLRMIAVLLFVGALWSCSSKPQPDADIEDRDSTVPIAEEYDVSFEEAWSAVRSVIDEYAMPVELVSEDDGIVRTEFMSGDVRDSDYVLVLPYGASVRDLLLEGTRFKLDIRVFRPSKEKTEIQITALIQGKCSSTNRDRTRYREGAWHDFVSTGGIEMRTHKDISTRLQQN